MSPRPRQETVRLRRRIEVRYGSGETRHVGFTGNLSTAGLMIRTTKVYPPGTVLALELRMPEGTWSLEGTVVWAREGGLQWLQTGRIGMGLRFVDPPKEFLKALRVSAATPPSRTGI